MYNNGIRRRGSSPARYCEGCGSSFYRTPSKVAGPNGRFCSKACSNRARRVPPETRFWTLVDRRGPDECWPWLAGRDRDGYGLFALSHERQIGAHRYALELTSGPLQRGQLACHHCDNPPCCNPSHLFRGTNLANRRDSIDKARHTHGQRHGLAKLTDADVLEIRRLYAETDISQDALSKRYGVSQHTISTVVRRVGWKHLN